VLVSRRSVDPSLFLFAAGFACAIVSLKLCAKFVVDGCGEEGDSGSVSVSVAGGDGGGCGVGIEEEGGGGGLEKEEVVEERLFVVEAIHQISMRKEPGRSLRDRSRGQVTCWTYLPADSLQRLAQ
jgi:hypothetical protein